MHPWLVAILGGVLIGVAAVLLMAVLGRIAGISGIAGALIRPGVTDRGWRLAFVLGLLIAPALLWLVHGDSGIGAPQVGLP
ncbi:MAG: YeeE/YedE family protein, partial [Rhodanobacter sp.]